MTGSVTLLALLLSHSVASWGLPPTVVPQADLEILEARLEETIAENRALRCPRPVLRGAPIPGGGGHDLTLLVEGGAGLAECYAFLGDFGEVLFGPPDGSERQTGLVNRFTELCHGLPGALGRAIGHEDACSPYVPGRRGLPDLQVLMLAIAGARQLAALTVLAGDPGVGARRFLDLIRLTQDLVRGGVPMVLAMRTSAVLREVTMNDLVQLVARPEVSPEDLAAMSEALGQLIASEPSFPRVIAADTTWLALEAGLPLLKPAGWEPPGGYSFGRQVTAAERSPKLVPWVPASRERAVIFSAFMALDRQRREACPLGASLPDCHAGLVALRQARDVSARTPSWIRWLRVLTSSSPRRGLRSLAEARVRGMVEVPFEGYVLEYASRSFQLAVVRFLVEVHRELRRTGRCPATEDLASKRWSTVMADPIFGGTLGTRRTGPGSFIVETGGRFEVQPGNSRPLGFVLSVPECED